MARLHRPLWGDTASGGLCNTLFYRNRSDYQTLCKKPFVHNRPSPAQVAQRAVFSGCRSAWLSLPDEDQTWWHNHRGDLATGYAAFMGDCML